MRKRIIFGTGFAVGYYFGAKAGRERYEQLNTYIDRFRHTEQVEQAAEKARAVIDLTVERAREVVEDRFGRGDRNGTPAEDDVLAGAASTPMPPAATSG